MPFSNLGYWPRSPVQFGQCKVTLLRGFNWNLLQWWGLVTALERHLGYVAALCSSFSRNNSAAPTFLWFLIRITELFNLEKTPLSSSSPTMKLGQLLLSDWFLINLLPESLVLKTSTWAMYLVLVHSSLFWSLSASYHIQSFPDQNTLLIPKIFWGGDHYLLSRVPKSNDFPWNLFAEENVQP